MAILVVDLGLDLGCVVGFVVGFVVEGFVVVGFVTGFVVRLVLEVGLGVALVTLLLDFCELFCVLCALLLGTILLLDEGFGVVLRLEIGGLDIVGFGVTLPLDEDNDTWEENDWRDETDVDWMLEEGVFVKAPDVASDKDPTDGELDEDVASELAGDVL